MNRRNFDTAAAVGVVGTTAGRLDRLASVADDIEFEDPDAQGEVHRSAKTFEVEVPNAEELFVSTTVRTEGSSRRGEMTLFGPDGDEVDSEPFPLDMGTSSSFTSSTGGVSSVVRTRRCST